MSKPNEGGPAFPSFNLDEYSHVGGGMSLREFYAGMALQGMLCNGFQPNQVRENHSNTADFNYARAAVGMADALIRELRKEQP